VKKIDRVIIFAAGDLQGAESVRAFIRPDDVIICADGGLRHARKLRVLPRAVIGDLDSVHRAGIWDLIEGGVKIMRYPPEKDRTDLDLAIEYAVSLEPSAVYLFGALGRRTDHSVGNLLLLVKYHDAGVPLRIMGKGEEIFLAGRKEALREKAGTVVSLVPLSPRVEGVSLEGFAYPLEEATLTLGQTRGMSNVLVSGKGSVTVGEGLLLIVVHKALPAPTGSAPARKGRTP